MTRRRRGERDKGPAPLAASDGRRRDDLERLAGGIAHDFRNVLAVIKGNIEIAEQRSADPRVKSLLIEAGRAAELGAAMTEQLLAFAHRRRAPVAAIDVADALLAIAPMLRAAAGPAIDVTIAAQPAAGRILADRIEFERVMVNLVANARGAMSAGGHVTVAAEPAAIDAPRRISSGVLDVARYVCISVADQGSGMAPGVLARALDPFFTTKPPGDGFGLGLSLACSFAIDAGGGLDLDSVLGRGTTATLFLRQML